jgi:hypothetical protein
MELKGLKELHGAALVKLTGLIWVNWGWENGVLYGERSKPETRKTKIRERCEIRKTKAEIREKVRN